MTREPARPPLLARALLPLAVRAGALEKRLGFALRNRGLHAPAHVLFALEHATIRAYLDLVLHRHRAALDHVAASPDTDPAASHDMSAWVVWWQGRDAAPEIVRACLDSAERNLDGVDVVLLDEAAIRSRVHFSRRSRERIEHGDLPLTQLSDLVRIKLLRRFGGVWADATLLFLPGARLPASPAGLITWRRAAPSDNTFVARGRWSTFLLGGPRELPLWRLIDEVFDIYWTEHRRLVDYHLFDYVIDYLYRHDLGGSRALLDQVPSSSGDVHGLGPLLLAGKDEAAVERLADDGPRCFKLSYKSPLRTDWVTALAHGTPLPD